MKNKLSIALVSILLLSLLVVGFAQVERVDRGHWCWTCKGEVVGIHRELCLDCGGAMFIYDVYACGYKKLTKQIDHPNCMRSATNTRFTPHYCNSCQGQVASSEILYRCPDCHGSVATKLTYKCGATKTQYFNHSGCMQ